MFDSLGPVIRRSDRVHFPRHARPDCSGARKGSMVLGGFRAWSLGFWAYDAVFRVQWCCFSSQVVISSVTECSSPETVSGRKSIFFVERPRRGSLSEFGCPSVSWCLGLWSSEISRGVSLRALLIPGAPTLGMRARLQGTGLWDAKPEAQSPCGAPAIGFRAPPCWARRSSRAAMRRRAAGL